MDKIKKIILFRIPMSICNLRCHYCYLSQRPIHFQGIQPEMKYTPEEVGYALRKERIGGVAYTNFCADGETLLLKNIDKYVKAVVEQGHYAEVVTNLTVTPVLDKFLDWPHDLLKRVEFKCSFHYLELKKQNKLELFAENANKIWAAGGSANIEITPSDELIPYIDEVMEFSMTHFGALPHLSIARDDRTKGIEYLTKLPMEEYDAAWSRFGSDFWNFKKTIFGIRHTNVCYAGAWSLYVNLCTGESKQCYCGKSLGNIFNRPETPMPSQPIMRCELAHCYNGHMLLTLGLIPKESINRRNSFIGIPGYGDIRTRRREDESEWLHPELKDFFNTRLEDSNSELSQYGKMRIKLDNGIYKTRNRLGNIKGFIYNKFHK